jgi:hypothetical protein
MNIRRIATALLFAAFLAPGTATAASLVVTATALPTAVLQGLPVALLVTMTNASTDAQAVLDGVRFQVNRSSEAFVARFGEEDAFEFPATANCESGGRCIVLAPGASRTLYFDFTSTLDRNPLFLDGRLSVPGEYRVQLEIHVDHQSAGVESVLSQPVSFTVLAPSGADAVFWQRMQRGAPGGTWSAADWMNVGRRIASDAYAQPTDSAYLPWIAGLVEAPTAQRVAAYDLALGKTIPPSLRWALLYGKAVLLNGASANAAWSDFNVDLALEDADAARAALDELVKVTTVDAVRQQAMDLRAQLLTPKSADELLKTHVALAPAAPLAVIPRVECVRRGSGNGFTAVFGYSNPNRSGKVLLIGDRNQVTPAPRDQGQPRFFQPGSHSAAFTGTSPGGQLTWHLDGSVATATADFPTVCSADMH